MSKVSQDCIILAKQLSETKVGAITLATFQEMEKSDTKAILKILTNFTKSSLE